MTYEDKQQFLLVLAAAVEGGSLTLLEVVEAATRGKDARYEKLNHMRAEAETSAMMLFNMVSPAKLAKFPLQETRIKQTLLSSGMFAGTKIAQQFESEIRTAKED